MGRGRFTIGMLVLIALGVGCSSTPSSDRVCDSQGCISLRKFSTTLSSYLENQVVGYVAIVGGLPAVTGGLARTSVDPPSMAMSADLPANIASVSKVLTTIGVLQSLAKNGLTLDNAISPYLYPDWVQGPNINTITFRDLLTHHSGFRQDCGYDRTTYSDLKTLIAGGVALADRAAASYNNCNFAIFRELLPFMEGQPITGSSDQRANQSASFYVSYMNQHVFQPVGISPRECKPPAGTSDILSYPFPAGSTPGDGWGDWTLACGGGGWVLSADDLYKIINDLANGNVLLTMAEKMQMNSNCLGWDGSDCSVMRDCPSPYNCKNGDLENAQGDINVWTYVGIVKCNVPVVVIVNSFLPAPYQPYDSNGASIPGSGDIIDLVKYAYYSAAVPGTLKPCP